MGVFTEIVKLQQQQSIQRTYLKDKGKKVYGDYSMINLRMVPLFTAKLRLLSQTQKRKICHSDYYF